MISAVIIILLTLAGAGTAIAIKLKQPKTQWTKIPLAGGAQYADEPHIDAKRLSEAFFKARDPAWLYYH